MRTCERADVADTKIRYRSGQNERNKRVKPFSLFLFFILLSLFLSSFPPSYFLSALMESLVTPLQDRIEDWKKTANQLDKDHAKGQTSAFHLPLFTHSANHRQCRSVRFTTCLANCLTVFICTCPTVCLSVYVSPLQNTRGLVMRSRRSLQTP